MRCIYPFTIAKTSHTEEDVCASIFIGGMDTSIVNDNDHVYIVDLLIYGRNHSLSFDIHKKVGHNLIWIDIIIHR